MLKLDPALFIWHDENNEIIGLIAVYVNNFLCTGISLFLETILGKLRKSCSVDNEERNVLVFLDKMLNSKVIKHC